MGPGLMILFPNCHHRFRGIIFSQIMFVSGGGAGKGGAVSFGGSTVCLGGDLWCAER